ncbi:uncharacterized protein UHOD_11507 [Ustilago sp. UG-2017b]|nr:uncharacterized protein UHOD_11507 [Ustilago sp. UG-2017b]
MSRPTKEAMQAALHIVKYLNQTQNEVLQIGGEDTNRSVIETYTDANWASDPKTDWKSTSGSVVKIFGSTVTWNLHIQKCIASSAVKAKYIAGSATTREALFHRHFLCGLRFSDHTPMVFANNTGCIQVAKDPACIQSSNMLTQSTTSFAITYRRVISVRGLAPETQVGLLGYSATIKLRDDSGWHLWYVLSQVSADLCGHSVQRWLGAISIDTTVMMTPRSGVSVDGDEIGGVGDKVGGVNTSVQCVD